MCDDVHGRATSQQRTRNAQAAQMYLDCASEARAQQRAADTTPGPVRAWERLTGRESQATAARRREAARQEADCAKRASAIWSSRSLPPKGRVSAVGSCPDAATKNAHRSARYDELVARINRGRVKPDLDPLLVERYPWCVDRYLNEEEEALAQRVGLDDRLWRVFTGTDDATTSGIKTWTEFDVSTCLAEHRWRDHMSGVHPMDAHAPSP
ncbi:hypothetical protein pkur_cds_554 [Pandoravirus kuranda]|uniref:Uncharacterized protein n=1 Tax=Pandoravirus kuranda TaxID=3019033 RepID=A0AA95J4H7_9VIRU|nr:hypothetical protein pkur_cds_554 [Pandoravirus kuranda]